MAYLQVVTHRHDCAGGMEVATSRLGPSLHVCISSAPEKLDSLARPEESVKPPEQSMRLEVIFECLQVSVWDDERRIILGPAPRSAAANSNHEQEAFCLSLDGFTASAGYSKPQGELHFLNHLKLSLKVICMLIPQTIWLQIALQRGVNLGKSSECQ